MTDEIPMNSTLSSLTNDQAKHLALGLEVGFACLLKPCGFGRYWLGPIEGGAIMMKSYRTVGDCWKLANEICKVRESKEIN